MQNHSAEPTCEMHASEAKTLDLSPSHVSRPSMHVMSVIAQVYDALLPVYKQSKLTCDATSNAIEWMTEAIKQLLVRCDVSLRSWRGPTPRRWTHFYKTVPHQQSLICGGSDHGVDVGPFQDLKLT